MVRLALAVTLALLVISCAGAPGRDAAVKPYPLDTCIVSGNRLGSMGDPITRVHDGQEVKFCCAPCIEEFEASPEAFLKQLPK